jgi:hypothetical protein
MNLSFRSRGVVLLVGMSSLLACGCGDNILSATQKVLAGQFCQLTPGEIKLLNQAAASVLAGQTPPVTIPILTDAQTTAVSDFFKLNSICSLADLEALPDKVDQGQQLQGVAAVATAFGIDPAQVNTRQLVQLLRRILGSTTGGQTPGAPQPR